MDARAEKSIGPYQFVTFSDLGRLVPGQVHPGHFQGGVVLAIIMDDAAAPGPGVGILWEVEELLQPPEADVALGDAPHDVRQRPDGELQPGEHGQDGEGLGGRDRMTRGTGFNKMTNI